MKDSARLEDLKEQRGKLQAQLREEIVRLVEHERLPPHKVDEALKSLSDKIHAVDRKILQLTPVSELRSRGDQLRSQLVGKTKADILGDLSLGIKFADQTAVEVELLRRERSRNAKRSLWLLFSIALVALILVLAKLVQHA
jgi:hypothetical protein